MAQAETRPTSAIVGGSSKVRIKLKLPGGAKKPQISGFPDGAAKTTGNQLADLHAAVEAFCKQGLRGLPGAVLLSPWREPSPYEQWAPEQQINGFGLQGAQQQQQQYPELLQQQQQQQQQQPGQPTKRRVRKRREPDTAADGADPLEVRQLAWGSIKRRRSNHHRAARSTAQLSNSIHSMLQQAPTGQGSPAPASPSVVSHPQAAASLAPGAAARSTPGAPMVAAQQPSRLQQSSGHSPSPAQQPPPAAVAATAAAAPPPGAFPQAPEASVVQAGEAADSQLMEIDEAPVAAAATAAAAGQPTVVDAQAAQPVTQPHQLQQHEAKDRQQLDVQRPEVQKQLEAYQQHMKPVQQSTEPAEQQSQQQKERQGPHAGHKQQQPVQPTGSRQAPAAAAAPPGAAKAPAVPAGAAAKQPAAVAAPSSKADHAGAPAAATAAAAADVKPESPPSETSHQQHIAAAIPQHLPQLLASTAAAGGQDEQQQQQQQADVSKRESPPGAKVQAQNAQQQQQQKQPEQTAVSRDRSQCSLPRGADAQQGPAAVSMPAPAAVPLALLAPTPASGAAGGSARLLELAPSAMTPAARVLAGLSAVPEVRQRILPPDDRQVRTQEEAISYLHSIMDKGKQLKHQGDRRHNSLGTWDVFGLSFYALSTVEFLLYWDTSLRLLNKLRASSQPVEKLQQQINNLSSAHFLRQTGQLSSMAMNTCSNCKGPDVAKQALRMLLERLSAITNLRHLHNQKKQLEQHVRVLKSNGASLGNGSSSSNGVRAATQQAAVQQSQQQARLHAARAAAAAAAAAVGKPPSPSGSSWSPAGQQQHFNKRSPDDSNTSNQERVQLLVGNENGAGGAASAAAAAGGAAAGAGAAVQPERLLQLAKSERALMDAMQELLRMTDGMHQTVMRMQQFLESPDVLASEHARTAALHISVLGLDAGMFSIPRVAAHTEAAVVSITKLLRTGS